MAKFLPVVVALLAFGIFAVAIIQGGILLGLANDSNSTIANDPRLSNLSIALQGNLTEYQENAKAAESSVGNSPVSFLLDNIIFDAIAGVWKGLKSIPTLVGNLFFGFLEPLLGPQFIFVGGVILGILTLIVIIAVWRLVHTGDGG